MGDVKLQIKLRADGSVESAEVISGHSMLKQAALDSVQKSTFMCEGCAGKKYTITYTFGFREDNECWIVQKRSMKCLNLWKCGPRFYQYGPPLVGQSPDRVIILADTQCIDTQAAGSASSP
jgi:Gram-negative bacterial TonB protein C-terminal